MYVYFVQADSGGPVKIGHAAKLDRHLEGLQAASPVTLVIRSVALGSAGSAAQLHRRFAADRLHADWFADSAELRGLMTRLPSHASLLQGEAVPAIRDDRTLILQMLALGYRGTDIADLLKVSRQRVSQITPDKPSCTLSPPPEPIAEAYARLRDELDYGDQLTLSLGTGA